MAANGSGDPAAPGSVAVACWEPAPAPSVQETIDRPDALVGFVVAERVPPAVASQVTDAPLTGLPNWSFASTTSESASAAPTVPVWLSPATRVSALGGPAFALAPKTTGEPARPATLAATLSELGPAAVPMVQATAARPAAFVVTVVAERLPDPAVTAQATLTPPAALP